MGEPGRGVNDTGGGEGGCGCGMGDPPGYWSWHRCSNRAKWMVKEKRTGEPSPRCGVHVKWYRRWGEVIGPAPAPPVVEVQDPEGETA